MAKAIMIDIAGIYRRIENARWVTERICNYYESKGVKTVVLRFARSYFVFEVGDNKLLAYPLSTTRFKWFNGSKDIYNFLVEKDIKAIWVFNGELNHNTIRELVKNDEMAKKHDRFWYKRTF